MTLKLVGAGFGRTGTWSTKEALDQLGLRCYHMTEVIVNKANKGHLDFWREVANAPPGSQHDWNRSSPIIRPPSTIPAVVSGAN